MVENQTEYWRFEQKSVIKFLVAEKCKPCEINRRICNVYEEASLNQKMCLLLRSWIEKTVYRVETQVNIVSPVNKKFLAQRSVKKFIWDMKGPSVMISLKKMKTVLPIANS